MAVIILGLFIMSFAVQTLKNTPQSGGGPRKKNCKGATKMKRDELKALGLEDAVIDKIMDMNGTDINAVKGKLTNAEETIQTLQATIGERDTDIQTLKETAGNSEELNTKLADLQSKYDADTQNLNSQIQQSKVNSALEMALLSNKARNSKAVKALIDMDKIELAEDGTINGLDEQLEALKTENDFLFESEEQPKTPKIVSGGNPTGAQGQTEPGSLAEAIAMRVGKN